MIDDSGVVQAEVIYRSDRSNSLPEPAIVWAVAGDDDSSAMPPPVDGDHCYTVTVSGVKISGAAQAPYEYAVCVLG